MPAPPISRLTAVVVTWERVDLTVRCVAALVDDGVPPGRIVVVDNGSRLEDVERLRSALAGPALVRLEENVGYARAANAGARRLEGDAYLIVNNDAFVQRAGSTAALLSALRDPAVGLVVPRLLNADLTLQPSVRPLPTPLTSLVLAGGVGRLLPNGWQPRLSHHWDHACSRAIDAANGAVLLIRREAWDELGGMNEARSMYAEDSELCWRARRLGWTIRFAADAEFVHLGNATGSRRWTDERRAALIGREEARLLREQLSPVAASFSFAAIWTYLTWRRAVFALAGNRSAAAVTRAARAGYLAGWRTGVRAGR